MVALTIAATGRVLILICCRHKLFRIPPRSKEGGDSEVGWLTAWADAEDEIGGEESGGKAKVPCSPLGTLV